MVLCVTYKAVLNFIVKQPTLKQTGGNCSAEPDFKSTGGLFQGVQRKKHSALCMPLAVT